MINIRDLHIERDILPLFDYTCNDFSRGVLTDLFRTPLPSAADILHRQEIIKGMLKNWKVLESYSYARGDLMEVHQLCKSVEHMEESSRIGLMLNSSTRQQLQTRLTQFILFMHRLYNRYFSLLHADAFPPDFGRKIAYIPGMLARFNLHRYEELNREGKFGTTHMVALLKILKRELTVENNTAFWDHLFTFEAYLSMATGVQRHQFVFPEMDAQGRFELKGFYHPLLQQPVKNDLVTVTNVMLITGPNMSGKSTLLKAIGICVYLAHVGVGVPAQSCIMPFFDCMTVAIDLKDDLKKGYSHFKTEINTLKDVVRQAHDGKRCFAIFDELFRGTNPEDALEISTTTIAGLSKFPHSRFFVSTHLYALQNTLRPAAAAMGVYRMQCSLESGRPEFTYLLKNGWSDLRIGRIIFEQEGLNGLLTHP
ncbi:MutS-related protein [Chitinophaga cymbidii]|uniref:DNA mismatch repair proteins mutS family domain-containing protein n=1 Tax=Chitinophaga cymbidii TaxID=1096750 RepID=A0A512RRG5_9BACT|nr:hypothetical protein [Chitinophaga cymbidii]GEP98266.1 hypothetical protein CCY01nite_45260 [Chitinophaga cymbidii]